MIRTGYTKNDIKKEPKQRKQEILEDIKNIESKGFSREIVQIKHDNKEISFKVRKWNKRKDKLQEYYRIGKINDLQKSYLERLIDSYELSQNLHNGSMSSYDLPSKGDRNTKEDITIKKIELSNFYREVEEKFKYTLDDNANKIKRVFCIRIPNPKHRKKVKKFRNTMVDGEVLFNILKMTFLEGFNKEKVKDKLNIGSEKYEYGLIKALDYLNVKEFECLF